MIKRLLAYWKTIVCAGLITYLSLVPKIDLNFMPTFSWRDKLFHLVAYCVLGLLLGLELRNDGRQGWGYWLMMIGLPILLGGVLEMLQTYFFYPRVGEWADFGANTLGVLIAGAICKIFVTR